MKKITLFFLSFLMVFAYTQAEQTRPTLSTDDTGPWYFIKAIGSDTRIDRSITVFDDTVPGKFVVQSTVIVSNPDTISRQLFRVVDAGDGNYKFINKHSGNHVGATLWSTSDNTERAVLASVSDPAEAFAFTLHAADPANWKDTENPPAVGDYWNITSPEPLMANYNYLHIGNSGWGWRIIYETSQWGVGENSSFIFLDYNDGLVVAANTVDCGTIMVDNIAEPLHFTWFGLNLTNDVTFEVTDGDIDWFAISEVRNDSVKFDSKLGGTYEVTYMPEELGIHEATLTLTSGDITYEVTLKGTCIPSIPMPISPDATHEKADANGDIWFRMQFNLRGYCVITDNGDGEQLSATYWDNSRDDQLWKLIEGSNGYMLVNKATGNYIDYVGGDTDRYITSATAEDNTFTFDLRTDGNWQIKWEQYVSSSTGELATTYLNKVNGDEFICTYGGFPDNGSSVAFFYADETYDYGFPTFSSGTDEHWYMIQFVRTEAAGYDRVFQYEGINESVTQSDKDIKNENQYWKLVGDRDNFQLINHNGNGVNKSGDNIAGISVEEGTSWKLQSYAVKTWGLYDINNTTYANDYGKLTVGYYSLDSGGELRFIKVDPNDIITSIDEIDFANDPVVATTYYNLQGVMVQEPNATGVYIVRYKHESGNYSARKILYRAN